MLNIGKCVSVHLLYSKNMQQLEYYDSVSCLTLCFSDAFLGV